MNNKRQNKFGKSRNEEQKKTNSRFDKKPRAEKFAKTSKPKLENSKEIKEPNEFKVEGRNAVIELLKSDREINKIMIQKGEKVGSINEVIKLARKKNIILSEVDKNKLDMLSDTKHHQGVIAFASPVEYKEVEYILEVAKQRGEEPFIIIADEIEDPHNLGAIIRSAEIAGCHGIIIPKRRAVAVTEIVEKVSCGATQYMPIARVNNLNETIRDLKEKGVWIVGTDGTAKELYYEQDLTGPIAIVVGSEGKGMSKLTMQNCDYLVKIPMMGKITSLNASVSAGIVMFEALKQRISK